MSADKPTTFADMQQNQQQQGEQGAAPVHTFAMMNKPTAKRSAPANELEDLSNLGRLADDARIELKEGGCWPPEADEVQRMYHEMEPDYFCEGSDALEDGVNGVAEGLSTLCWAAKGGRGAIVLALLRLKADPNARMENGTTALHEAVADANPDAVQWLVADPRTDLTLTAGGPADAKTALALAAEKGDAAVQQAFLTALDAVDGAREARVPAAERALLETPQLAFEAAALALDAEGLRAAFAAAPAGAINVNAGADKTVFGTVFNTVVNAREGQEGDRLARGIATLRALIELGADASGKCFGANTGGWGGSPMPPLFAALHWRNIPVALALIEAGADINETWSSGLLPIHRPRDPAVVRALAARGADANAGAGKRRCPLHEVSDQNDVEVMPALVAAGADVNAVDPHGYPALRIAGNLNGDIDADFDWERSGTFRYLKRQHLVCMRVLAALGADVNAKWEGGFTALHRACQVPGAHNAILLLRALGADTTAVTEDGRTALHFAAAAPKAPNQRGTVMMTSRGMERVTEDASEGPSNVAALTLEPLPSLDELAPYPEGLDWCGLTPKF